MPYVPLAPIRAEASLFFRRPGCSNYCISWSSPFFLLHPPLPSMVSTPPKSSLLFGRTTNVSWKGNHDQAAHLRGAERSEGVQGERGGAIQAFLPLSLSPSVHPSLLRKHHLGAHPPFFSLDIRFLLRLTQCTLNLHPVPLPPRKRE